jgi:hypothetical protein
VGSASTRSYYAQERPYGRFARALQTQERSALEPDVVDAKYYVHGVGEVYEGAVRSPKEELRLVEIIS